MKASAIIPTFFLSFFTAFSVCAQTTEQIEAGRIMLPTGWELTPVGKSLNLGDLPLNYIFSPDRKLAAVTNNGQSIHSIQLISVEKQIVLDDLEVGKAWLGLAFGNDSRTLYASGGNDNWIYRFDIRGNKLAIRDTIIIGKPWPERISVAGISLDDARQMVYAVTRENNSLYVISTGTKKVIKKLALGAEGYTCILSPDKKILYISCWGCDRVQIFDTDKLEMKSSVPVGDNPNDMVVDKKGLFLYVSNANDNSVSVINLKENRVIEVLNTALYPNAPSGSTANSLALSDDDKTLYVANADNNCLAVFNVSEPGNSSSLGFIPTGWYPTCVRILGKSIFVTNGKGYSSFANPLGPNPYRRGENVVYQRGDSVVTKPVEYIGGLFKGTLSIITVPDEKQMAVFSQAVYRNTPYTKKKESLPEGYSGNPIPSKVGDVSPIKYVFYVIKENRTYDQVLGDIPEGNGDISLVLFGEKVTPNQHKLAREFVLLDNFYVNGEVSADGHNWSMGAYATDYMEKHWPTSYGDRGGDYDSEGQREIGRNKVYLWDLCRKYGVTYRTYGEFIDGTRPTLPSLYDHYCPYFTSWDETVRDTTRFHQWKRDFDSLVAVNQVPRFNSLRFINDHTEGLRLGRPTPNAHVADNDLAVGLFVEHLSKSPIWKESAVFIVEDDAQNGPDHVDAHRTTAYVAGPFVKRKFVDNTMYSTSSMLRTMELILGLPPMSQYDAAAEPMWRCFTSIPDVRPFSAVMPRIDLDERNTAMNKWQRMSEEFYFGKEDRAPDAEFNQVLWFAIKGDGYACPPPVRSAFIKVNLDEDENED
ncbi:MAG TPA: bifunctional YncE family protein/alkaline phosphatase family protein [Cyclobacteriaceae bacterium]|nr:bifunctional YncE family protein/alkaline phosphatase family protein [Cyclobacteriaceae bacterium]